VVPGDADQDAGVLQELGRVAAVRLMRMLKDGMILAVSGGGTVAAAANALPGGARMDIDVLPARGGMGASVEIQADTLAAELARKLGGRYALLHLPDSITPGALEELKRLPEIGEPLNAMRRADLMLHGIGRADVMARNRHLPESDIRRILEQGAVAEALGAYFDLSGNLVHQASGIGVLGGQLGAIPAIVALAAGRGKAEAILAVARHHRHSLIITDEGAGREILNLLRI
jgi:central glycolytic genes regulator